MLPPSLAHQALERQVTENKAHRSAKASTKKNPVTRIPNVLSPGNQVISDVLRQLLSSMRRTFGILHAGADMAWFDMASRCRVRVFRPLDTEASCVLRFVTHDPTLTTRHRRIQSY